MEEEASLEANPSKASLGLEEDIDSYMNDTSHVDDIAGLISPPVEEVLNTAASNTENRPSDEVPANTEDEKEAAAKKIQDIANKKKERDDAKKVVNDLRVKKTEEVVKKNDAASKIQDIAAKKLERLEAQKVTNELRAQRDSKLESGSQQNPENSVTNESAAEPITENSTPGSSKPSSSRFVGSKRQAVEDNKLGTTSASDKDLFNLDNDDELQNFKPTELKVKLQDSFKNPPEHIKKKVNSSNSVDASPMGSKGGSSRSMHSDSSGGGSSRNLEDAQRKKDGKLRFEKMIRRGSIKNHNTLMAPDVDHDDHDGEFTFDLKSEFGVSESHLQVANQALSPKPPDQPLDAESVPSTRKKSIRVIEPAASAAATSAVETVSPKSAKLSQKIKRKPTNGDEDPLNTEGVATTTEERVSSPKRNKSVGEGLKEAAAAAVKEGEEASVPVSSKMKPIRRKSRRAADSNAVEEGEGAALAAESNSSKENKPISEEQLPEVEVPKERPPKLKISKSARVRSVGSTPNVGTDVTPLLNGDDHSSSNGRLMSVDDIASPSSSVVIGGKEPAVRKVHKPKIKLPELVSADKRAGVANNAVESSSDRKRRSVVDDDEYDEATGGIKKKKPLYLRIIERANRQKQEEERLRNEQYNLFRQSRPKNTPSRKEIKEHMAKYDEMMKMKQDAARETLAAKVKPFKRPANAVNSRFLPPLFSPSKAHIDGAEGVAAVDDVERLESEDPLDEKKPQQKSKYNSPSNKMKLRLQVEEDFDLLANDEKKERLKKQKEMSEKVREDLHHKAHHKTPEKLPLGGEEGSHVGVSPSKKNIHRSPSKADHSSHPTEVEPHLPEAENDESMLVMKMSPRSRSKHHKALASEHNRMHHESHHAAAAASSHPQRSRKPNNSSALKDMDGNLVFPNGVSDVVDSSYSQDYFNSGEAPAQLDPAVLITYCASDWIDRLKDNSSTVLVDDDLSRMLSDM